MKKITALFLIISLLVISSNLHAKERRGADLLILKTDGQVIRGELIAVKQNSLLLKDSKSRADMSVDIKDIKVITIKKKSKTLLGAGIGFLTGAVLGNILAEGWKHPLDEFFEGTAIFGSIGALIVGISAAGSGADEIIEIEKLLGRREGEFKIVNGKRQLVIKERKDVLDKILNKLRSKARIRDFQ